MNERADHVAIDATLIILGFAENWRDRGGAKLGKQNLIAAGSALLLLAGCSASGWKHAICIDAESTDKYDTDWQDALREARKSGKISLEAASKAQGKRYEKLSSKKFEKSSVFCDNLDSVRAEIGF